MSSEPHSSSASPSFASLSARISGCLLGGAAGDALAGAGAAPHGSDLPVSAHTQLALYSLDGLQEAIEWANGGVAADETACIWLAYLRWLRGRGMPLPDVGLVPQPRPIDAEELLRPAAPEGRPEPSPDPEVVAALSTGEMGTRQRPVNTGSPSPAPLVRSAPFGLLPYVETETVYKLSLDAASLTHGHPAARHAAAVFASTVHGLLAPGATLRDAAGAAVERAAHVPADDGGAPDLVAGLRSVLAGDAGSMEEATASGALARGLHAALAVEDGADAGPVSGSAVSAALGTAAAAGGAPAAIVAGSLLGTRYGAEAVPDAEKVREYPVLAKLAAAFCAATIAP